MKLNFLTNRWFLFVAFIILCASAVYFSIKCITIGTVISTLGSIASLYAIVEAIIRMRTIEEQNREIKKAVDDKIVFLNKQETTEQVNKYAEVISRIISYIELRNAEAALLKIEELQIFLHSIQCNPTTSEDAKKEITRLHKTIKSDVLVLRDKNQFEPFPKDADCKELTKHFVQLQDLLVKYSQQIHFDK